MYIAKDFFEATRFPIKMKGLMIYYPRPCGGGYSTLCACACACVCVCVCVLPQNCNLTSIISKSKQAASHKFGNLRQKVVLYKTGKLLQASVAQIA